MYTHTHTHTQGKTHTHKQIQTHANTRTQKKKNAWHTSRSQSLSCLTVCRVLVRKQTDYQITPAVVSIILLCQARPQGVENSELGYVPARQTTLFHHGARKVDCDSEKPTTDGQRDIRLQETVVRAQPGDTSSLVVRSWDLDGHRRAGCNWTGSSRGEKRMRHPSHPTARAARSCCNLPLVDSHSSPPPSLSSCCSHCPCGTSETPAALVIHGRKKERR